MDILYYDNGYRYARLISHNGKTALVEHPVRGTKRVSL